MPSNEVKDKAEGSGARLIAMATELPFVIVCGAAAGGFLGFLIDRWLHTKPWMLVILGIVGFFVGLRDVLRRVQNSGSGTA